MLFFTDLDKTIVYSGYPEHYCVEYKEKQEITYMTNEGKRQLDNLFKKEGFRMIPCTLRSFEQTKRIEFITDELTPVVICDNGFSIYNKGVLDKSWDKKMQSYIVKYPMSETYKEIDDLITTANIPISQIKSNRDAFFTVIFKNIADAEYFSDKIILVLPMNRIYACIDLKSFYASVECVERNLDPMTTNLVVADKERTEKTICLAVTPSLKSYGIPGRARLFEVIKKVKEINYKRKKHIKTFTGKSYNDVELIAKPNNKKKRKY